MRDPQHPSGERLSPPPDPSTASRAEALYFDCGTHRLFGWLHRGRPVTSGLGAVICQPAGHEATAAHRSLRALAEAAAAVGVSTLRFDYAGQGDSGDIDPEADQIEHWSQDVVAAVRELQRRIGVQSVCLLGLRLGALLALTAVGQCPMVRSLVLIAPVLSGRLYLRQLRGSTPMAWLPEALWPRITVAPGVPGGPSPGRTGALEVGGLRLSEASLERLARMDLREHAAPPVAQMQVIDRQDIPCARAWSDAVAGAGVHTEHVSLAGIPEMLRPPGQVPHDMVATVTRWLQSLPRAGRAAIVRSSPVVEEKRTLLTPPGNGSRRSLVQERPVFFGSDAGLFGIVSEPRQSFNRRAVILLSRGADLHVGGHRGYVRLARQWAERGAHVLRADLAGLGESETRAGRKDHEVLAEDAIEDIRAAVSFMRTRYGAVDVALAGFGSGAYHALFAAAAGAPVSRIVLVNPRSESSGEQSQDRLREAARKPDLYWERMLSMKAWRRPFVSRLQLGRAVSLHSYRLWLALQCMLRDQARSLGIRWPGDLGAQVERIAARGAQVAFVFASGEPGIDQLRVEAGSVLRRMGSRCRVHIIESDDRTFSQTVDRMSLERVLRDELFPPRVVPQSAHSTTG